MCDNNDHQLTKNYQRAEQYRRCTLYNAQLHMRYGGISKYKRLSALTLDKVNSIKAQLSYKSKYLPFTAHYFQ